MARSVKYRTLKANNKKLLKEIHKIEKALHKLIIIGLHDDELLAILKLKRAQLELNLILLKKEHS